MEKLFAVSHISFDANELTTEFHYAENWRAAALMHRNIAECFPEENEGGGPFPMPDDKETAKQAAFDQDMMFESVEVPTEE